ncbi:alpha-galactosidase [Thermosipho ferrireducens]|uniref:Alpha-galactosidase n=1 Tax=Thermosipho ferrireducens TaxID=2571116 RepID=A0ABX7SA22_9BACT|nr:alpha-galactosidase [Thermosipho ferrireducens]QTA38100.1 alpha-galactosidase [Thermosipho ferrireducens]
MKILGHSFEDGKITFEAENFVIRLKVKKIPEGYIISGEIKGKPKRVEIFRTEMPEIFFINNWQSWGPAKKMKRGEKLKIPEKILENFGYGFNPNPHLFEQNVVSDYFYGEKKLVVGFLSSKYAHPFFLFDGHEVVGYLDYFEATYEDFIPLEPLIILHGNLDDLLPVYAEYVKLKNNLQITKRNPVGWSSWYQYFSKLTWEDILKNLGLAKEYLYEVFQIDDSWEIDIGDWQPNEKFPPLEEMAKTIRKHGFIPGIWIAPFSVSETSLLAKNHKDWLVKDENDSPLLAYRNWNKNIYALDITNEEAAKWLKNIFKRLKDAGFEYFKIDFLFAGAIPGKRHLNISPIEAYRLGLKFIREVVEDSFILGCGAPLLPSVGLVDGMRIGPDTAPYYNPETPGAFIPNAFYALRNTITRYYMNGKWWWNDPDCLLLRNIDTELNLWEKKAYAFVSGMLNNMIIQSDDLSLSIERYLLDSALKLRGGRAFVKGLMEEVYEIFAEGTGIGNVKLRINLKKERSELSVDEKSIKLLKQVKTKGDGRKFNYYQQKGDDKDA